MVKPKAKVTPVGRFSYPNLYQQNEFAGKDKATYDIVMIFDKDTDLSKMKKDAEAAAREKWGSNIPAGLVSPFLDGNLKPDKPELQDKTYIRFKRRVKFGRPQVVGRDPSVHISEESGELYAGCYGKVSYDCYTWSYGGKHGVAFGLNNVQKLSEGEPLGGGSDASQEFDAVDDVDDEDVF